MFSGFGVTVELGDVMGKGEEEEEIERGVFCAVMFQYPDTEGAIRDYSKLTHKCTQAKVTPIKSLNRQLLSRLSTLHFFCNNQRLSNSRKIAPPLFLLLSLFG